MSAMLRRPITSGSRQAPDPYDQFLESRNLYRKHTARDASCLFRVIAEQMYDTQMLHYEVRLECVRFMTRKRRIFEKHVRGDFDSYLRDMMKPRTYGTMLELRAVCCMYRRNAILFEPFNLGSVVTYSSKYRENFKVFYTNEYHFDSVYTVDYIKEAAFCQSICFKLLYKMLFKLPDVKYAVEAMLHPHSFDWGNCEVTMDSRGYVEYVYCRDGRTFHLDMPENTSCILENYKLCNFHNSRFVDNENNASSSSVFGLPPNNLTGESKSLDLLYMCPNRFNSCVRQLLDDGITPFPYKVAKSLDNYMYRNIEFDSWNDLRKEAKRYNIYANDYNFKVGAKCRVELKYDAKVKMYTCHIQKIHADKSHCVVFVEQIGNKFVVPYMALHPLPPDEFRPWSVPFRFRRPMHNMQLSKHIAKPKPSKWKKSKLYDVNYFDTNKCDAMKYLQMGNYYGDSFFDDEPQQHRQHEIIEQAELPTGLQQPQQLPKPLPEAGPTAAVLQQKQPAAAPSAPYINYLTPPWMNASLPMPEEYHQASLFSRPPPSSDGCMYMHYGDCTAPPPPPPTAPLPSQRLPLPPFGTAPFMIAPPQPPPPPSFVVPQFSSSTSNNSGNSNRNSCTNSVTRKTATRSNEDQSEQRASLYSISEDLPSRAAADLLALQKYYNDVHARMAQIHSQDEQMRQYCNNMLNIACHHNLIDQQQQRMARNACLTTPPPTPDVATTSGGITLSGVAPSTKREKDHFPPKRNYNLNKVRSKGRPEPLTDLGKYQQFAQASMLPTPSPSPNTQDNKFVFYPAPHSSPASQSAYQPQPQTSGFYAAIKAGQNPYPWNMPTIAQPHGAMNMVEFPCDLFNNYKPEQNCSNNAQKPLTPSNYAPPRH